MAAKVLFFGQDIRRRIPAIEQAGYSLHAYPSVGQMSPAMIQNHKASFVAVSGVWKPFLHDPIAATRSRTHIPFVLFAGHEDDPGQSIFDLVVPADHLPSRWLSEIDILLRECRATRAEARNVQTISNRIDWESRASIEHSRVTRELSRLQRLDSQAVRERSRLERERSIREISRHIAGVPGTWNLEEVRGIADFLASAPPSAEPCHVRDWLIQSITAALARLTAHLWKMMRLKLDNGVSAATDELQSEAQTLTAEVEALLLQWESHRAMHGC